ncbi:MAG: DUF6155 family protein [Bacteroidia bacterium]
MSKRDLKKYLAQLPKEQLEEQLLALYEKFPEVKTYYNFVFNPREDKLEQEAKIKIGAEYFPPKGKRPKLRKGVAQKFIKHFISLGVDSFIIADIMLYNIEIAQAYAENKYISQEAFYKSIQNSYKQVIDYVVINGISPNFKGRIEKIYNNTLIQKWPNRKEFERLYDNFE